MTRAEILKKADVCVNGTRQMDYGNIEDNFQTIAALWNTYLRAATDFDNYIDADDVAAMMILLKVARVASGHAKDDNWVDIAGYAACGGELQEHRTAFTVKDMEGHEMEVADHE